MNKPQHDAKIILKPKDISEIIKTYIYNSYGWTPDAVSFELETYHGPTGTQPGTPMLKCAIASIRGKDE